jgi:hypothetical protein
MLGTMKITYPICRIAAAVILMQTLFFKFTGAEDFTLEMATADPLGILARGGFYPPVVLAVVAMGLRRRNLLAFTAVNPAIPHGGISGESKTEILNHLVKSGCVAPFVSLSATDQEKLKKVEAAFDRFPLVVKPDVGEGIRLIELNGVTSEATHIYHPHTPLLHGYRTLIQQWRHAYDIGIANAASGARVTTWHEFATILRHHQSRNPTENAPTPQ